MKALLVDDEPLARRELRRLLAAHPGIEVVGEAGNADEATAAVARLAPDLLFLDIHMPQRDGFALLESLDDAPQVIFTTAHDEHALAAFEVGALDYLVKPIAPARLAAALGRARARVGEVGAPAAAGGLLPPDRPLLVREGGRSWFVCLRDVALVESVGNYVELHLGAHRPLLLHSLRQLDQRLDPAAFFRANRRQLVNLAFVDHFEDGEQNELVAHLRDGRTVAFSRRQSVAFRRQAGLPGGRL